MECSAFSKDCYCRFIQFGRLLKDEPPIEDEDDDYEEDDTDESEFLIIDEDAIN